MFIRAALFKEHSSGTPSTAGEWLLASSWIVSSYQFLVLRNAEKLEVSGWGEKAAGYLSGNHRSLRSVGAPVSGRTGAGLCGEYPPIVLPSSPAVPGGSCATSMVYGWRLSRPGYQIPTRTVSGVAFSAILGAQNPPSWRVPPLPLLASYSLFSPFLLQPPMCLMCR